MLLAKIKEYIADRWMDRLCRETGLSSGVISALLEGNSKHKFRATTLDILYHRFWLYKDFFYYDNLAKRYPKTESMVGQYIRHKRIAKNMSVDELARQIKSWKLAILRIELGESLPHFNSYTMKSLFESLDFSDKEKKAVEKMIDAVKDIEVLLRSYTKDAKKNPFPDVNKFTSSQKKDAE